MTQHKQSRLFFASINSLIIKFCFNYHATQVISRNALVILMVVANLLMLCTVYEAIEKSVNHSFPSLLTQCLFGMASVFDDGLMRFQGQGHVWAL